MCATTGVTRTATTTFIATGTLAGCSRRGCMAFGKGTQQGCCAFAELRNRPGALGFARLQRLRPRNSRAHGTAAIKPAKDMTPAQLCLGSLVALVLAGLTLPAGA